MSRKNNFIRDKVNIDWETFWVKFLCVFIPILVFVLVFSFMNTMLLGCATEPSSNMELVHKDSQMSFYREPNTNVMYVTPTGLWNTALTVMLDPDGNPLLYENWQILDD